MPEPLITPALRHRSGRAPRLPACSVRRGLVLLLAGLWTGLARAHEFNAGDIVIEHPYALPTLPGVTTGAVYFRSLRNAGHAPERLLGARTDVAASVQLTRGLAPGGAAPRTVLSSIDLTHDFPVLRFFGELCAGMISEVAGIKPTSPISVKICAFPYFRNRA